MLGPTGDPAHPFYNPDIAPSEKQSEAILFGLKVASMVRNVGELARRGPSAPQAGLSLFLQLNTWVADNINPIYQDTFTQGVYSPEGISGQFTN